MQRTSGKAVTGFDEKIRFDQAIVGGGSDYDRYLSTNVLLACQKEVIAQSNDDELQFQVVHQIEELWMKLLGHSLINAIGAIRSRQMGTARDHFDRVFMIQERILDALSLLHTMTPESFAAIRPRLGDGKYSESANLRQLDRLTDELKATHRVYYLDPAGLTLRSLQNEASDHEDARALAERIARFVEQMQQYRDAHTALSAAMLGAS